MKMLMMIVVLIGLLALGAWQMGYVGKKTEVKKEEQKIEIAATTEAQEKKISESAEKAKVEAETQAKAEVAAKAEAEKNKADAEARLAELTKQYEEKKASFIAMSKEKKTYEAALKDIESAGAECVSTISEYQSKAKSLISQMKAVEDQISAQAKEVKKAKNNLTQADSFIGGQRDKKDRIGWRYTGSSEIRPMSEYNSRNKSKTVKFVYKEDTRKQDGLKDASSAHSKELAELTELKSKLAELKKQSSANKAQYKSALENKINQLSSDMRNAKDEGKKLDDEIDKLKQG